MERENKRLVVALATYINNAFLLGGKTQDRDRFELEMLSAVEASRTTQVFIHCLKARRSLGTLYILNRIFGWQYGSVAVRSSAVTLFCPSRFPRSGIRIPHVAGRPYFTGPHKSRLNALWKEAAGVYDTWHEAAIDRSRKIAANITPQDVARTHIGFWAGNLVDLLLAEAHHQDHLAHALTGNEHYARSFLNRLVSGLFPK